MALGRPQSLSEAQVGAAREELSEGLSVAAVARALNTSRQTVMRLRDRAAV